MANMNIRTPRFFVDHVNYLLSRGVANTNVGVESGTDQIDVQTGSAIELFDMKPLNQVNFNTSDDTDGHVNIWVDLNKGGSADHDYMMFIINVLADMDTSDTAYVQLHIPNAGSAQSDIVGSQKTTFSGFLAC